MGEQWKVVGADWSSEPACGAWWDALALTLQNELAGTRPLGLRVEVGALGELVLRDLDGALSLKMRRVDAGWSSHRWTQTGASERPLLLNENMPYINVGKAPSFSPFTLDPEAEEEQVSAPIEVDVEDETAQVVFEWGTGAVSPASAVGRMADRAMALRVEAACVDLCRAQTREEAADIALEVLRRFISVERGAVMLAGPEPDFFEVATLRGVAHAEEARLRAPAGRGLGAFVSTTGIATMVNAPGTSAIFRPAEIATGDSSQALFAVPVLDLSSGMFKGIIELSRPTLRFQHWQLEVGVAVAAALSEALERIAARGPRRMAIAI